MGTKECRSWDNRKSSEDRRKFNDSNYKGPERRSGEDRRCQGECQSSLDCHTILAEMLRIA